MFPLFMATQHRVAYEIVVAQRDTARDILSREMQRSKDHDVRLEPDAIKHWTRQCELFEGVRLKLSQRWGIR